MKQDIIHIKYNRYTGSNRSDIKDYSKPIIYKGFKILHNRYVPNGAENKYEIPELLHLSIGGEIKGYYAVSKTQAFDAIDKWFVYNENVNKLKI